MIKEQDLQIENVSGFKVRGHKVSATFEVVIAPLKWTEVEAVEFTNAVGNSHPDLLASRLFFEQSDADGEVLSPTPVERVRFRWIGELDGPQPREKVEAEFDSRQAVVVSMLSEAALTKADLSEAVITVTVGDDLSESDA